ncbi:MAG: hypothetical protein ACKO26_05060 [Planctomycetota bacterium]
MALLQFQAIRANDSGCQGKTQEFIFDVSATIAADFKVWDFCFYGSPFAQCLTRPDVFTETSPRLCTNRTKFLHHGFR